MRERKVEPVSRRLGFMIPLLVFVLLLVLCCGVIACVFLRADAVSRQAEAETAAVTLCRNQAEQLRAGVLPELDTKIYYNASLEKCGQEQGSYYIVVTGDWTETGAGRLFQGKVTAYSIQDQPIYALDAAAYLPDGR